VTGWARIVAGCGHGWRWMTRRSRNIESFARSCFVACGRNVVTCSPPRQFWRRERFLLDLILVGYNDPRVVVFSAFRASGLGRLGNHPIRLRTKIREISISVCSSIRASSEMTFWGNVVIFVEKRGAAWGQGRRWRRSGDDVSVLVDDGITMIRGLRKRVNRRGLGKRR